jgi:hypothetical protein
MKSNGSCAHNLLLSLLILTTMTPASAQGLVGPTQAVCTCDIRPLHFSALSRNVQTSGWDSYDSNQRWAHEFTLPTELTFYASIAVCQASKDLDCYDRCIMETRGMLGRETSQYSADAEAFAVNIDLQPEAVCKGALNNPLPYYAFGVDPNHEVEDPKEEQYHWGDPNGPMPNLEPEFQRDATRVNQYALPKGSITGDETIALLAGIGLVVWAIPPAIEWAIELFSAGYETVGITSAAGAAVVVPMVGNQDRPDLLCRMLKKSPPKIECQKPTPQKP